MAAYQVVNAHVTLTGVWIRELIDIPAGDFIMGSDPSVDSQAWPNEQPQHIHPTGEYYIGRFEITNEEFAAFLADDGYHNPAWWSSDGWAWREQSNHEKPYDWNGWPETTTQQGMHFPDYPIEVSWFEAEAFCNWAGEDFRMKLNGKKLPEELMDGSIHGETIGMSTKCQCNKNGIGMAPVGAHSPQGDSPYGVADALGNAFEMTSDWWDQYIYQQYAAGNFSPPVEDPGLFKGYKTDRGGSYASTHLPMGL